MISEIRLLVPRAARIVIRAIHGKFRVEGKHRAMMSAGPAGASRDRR
jgi:hypothetical protein